MVTSELYIAHNKMDELSNYVKNHACSDYKEDMAKVMDYCRFVDIKLADVMKKMNLVHGHMRIKQDEH